MENIVIEFTKWKPVDTICIRSYIGILLLSDVYKSKHEKLPSLWDDIKGHAIFINQKIRTNLFC